MKTNKAFDIIIFGASGFIGRHTALKAVTMFKDLSWAVAGRNREKLQLIVRQIGERTLKDLRELPILIADVKDEHSIIRMVEDCEVLINCCGPIQLCGEVIIKNCIKSGTHYVDISNDPYFNELMQLKYHESAEENNIYVVSACGFQSFAMEMGLNFMQENFNGTINYVDAYVKYGCINPHVSFGPIGSDTVWKSMILACSKIGELPHIRQCLRRIPWPFLLPKQPIKRLLHRPDQQTRVTFVRFPLIDQQDIERSQYYFYKLDKKRPIQFYKYLVFPRSFLLAFLFALWTLVISLMANFDKTREIVIEYPRLFSVGLFSPKGPDLRIVANTKFQMTLYGVGWSRYPTHSVYELNDERLDQAMCLEISGINPIYNVGCLCLLLSALTVLQEQDVMPNNGGVYPPGYAFKGTSLFNRMDYYDNYINIRISEPVHSM
ncbi:lipid droplet localized protein-like isoform 1-T2 [Glossina fuscipes fuscipes]